MDITPMHPAQPNQAEPVQVQLTRMEGTINLVALQVGGVQESIKDLRTKVEGHGTEIELLKLANAAQSGASGTWRTWLPILAAIAGVLVAIVAIYSK